MNKKHALVLSYLPLILFIIWIVWVSISTLSIPQCPDNYTQEQVDNSDCVIGANIGGGLLIIFGGPFAVVVSFLLWQYQKTLYKRLLRKK